MLFYIPSRRSTTPTISNSTANPNGPPISYSIFPDDKGDNGLAGPKIHTTAALIKNIANHAVPHGNLNNRLSDIAANMNPPIIGALRQPRIAFILPSMSVM